MPISKPKAVAIFSGGMDSTVLIYDLLKEYEVHALSFMYGQRHRKELDFAMRTARTLKIPHHIVPLNTLGQLLGGSSLTDASLEVPEGHYTDETMRSTIVPNRNAIMLSIAYGHAIAIRAQVVATAVHAGDHAIYPDCRSSFLSLLEEAFQEGCDSSIELVAPYVMKTKTEIAQLGMLLDVPFQDTWSCYKGGEIHCGRCGTCVERKEALYGFDPTRYEHA
jgi:7-cyano-7-deazaguanine synthase